jgi:flagellar basal-body rod protein FlgF
MDAFLYTAVSGADATQRALAVHANNLANAQTAGFRADVPVSESLSVSGYGYSSRMQAAVTDTAVDPESGRLTETGRDLDIAIQGPGYFSVQTDNGVAYTRAGSFSIDAQGTLVLDGHPVLGDGGPIVLPEHAALDIGSDGSISVLPVGGSDMEVLDRLALVSPEPGDMVKRSDGLLGSRSGVGYPRDEQVQVVSGQLEGSNVSAVEEMMQTMQLSRSFEMQMRIFSYAEEIAESGDRLIRG